MKSLTHRLSRVVALCAVSFASFLQTALAQDSPSPFITTERASVGPSADILPKGSFQTESGAGTVFQKHGCAFDLPQNFVRVGVSDRLEVRLQTSDVVFRPMQALERNRVANADNLVSAKFLMKRGNLFAPKAGILSLSLPLGDRTLTSGTFDPGLAFIWTQALEKGFFVNEVAQGTLATFSRARRATWAPSIAVGHALSRHLAALAEYAPSFRPDHTVSYVVDGGLTYARGKFQQFDVRSGYLEDGAGRHTLISVGYSIRRDHFLGRELFHHPTQAFN